MAIHKLKKHQEEIPYSMLSRDVIQSIKNPDSLAIWTHLQSLPDNWDISEKHLRETFNIGRTRYLSAMKLLREMGLYEVIRITNSKNQFIGNYYHIYESPQVSVSVHAGKPYIRETDCTENRTYIKEKTPLKRRIKDKEKDTPPKKYTIPADIDQELWDEFMRSRRRLKASSSQTAIKILLTTLDKCVAAGFTRNQAISEAIERGWKSVKPEWLKNSVKSTQSFAEQKNERRKAAGEEWLHGGSLINSTCERVQ